MQHTCAVVLHKCTFIVLFLSFPIAQSLRVNTVGNRSGKTLNLVLVFPQYTHTYIMRLWFASFALRVELQISWCLNFLSLCDYVCVSLCVSDTKHQVRIWSGCCNWHLLCARLGLWIIVVALCQYHIFHWISMTLEQVMDHRHTVTSENFLIYAIHNLM